MTDPVTEGRRIMSTAQTAHRARLVMLAAAGGLLLIVAFLTRGALVPFFLGAALAFAIAPVVDRLAALFPFQSRERARGAAILTLYAVFAGILVLLGIIFVPTIAHQLSGLADDLPSLIDQGQEQLDRWQDWYVREIPESIRNELDVVSGDIRSSAGGSIRGALTSVAGALYQTAAALLGFAVIPVWLFYVLKDRGRAAENFVAFLPEGLRDHARNIAAIINRTMGSYLRAQILLGIIVGVVDGIGLYLLDVQFAFGLAVIAGITEMIPIIGPIIGAVPGILVALAVNPEKAVWVALLYLAVQQMENHILVPRIQGAAVHLNPAIIILLLVMANALVGFWGMFVVIPLAAMAKDVFLYVYDRLGDLERRAGEPLLPMPEQTPEQTPEREPEANLRRPS